MPVPVSLLNGIINNRFTKDEVHIMGKIPTKKGFTLIELVVSISVLSIITLSFLGVFADGFSTIINSGRKTKAVEEAQKIMDMINVRESSEDDFLYNVINTSGFKDNFISGINSTLHDGTVVSDISASTSILTSPNSSSQDLYNRISQKLYCVTITVEYENGTKSVSLTSLIPQGGNL